MKVTSLKEHPIHNTITGITKQYVLKCDRDNPSNNPPETATESYAFEIMYSIININSCLDQLHYSVELLSGYRKQTAPKGMNRSDYITYGIENHYLRLTSVYDRCLRLTNIVYKLGLPEKECKESTIIKNKYIKDTDIAKHLKLLNKFTSDFRQHRNNVAHNSTYSEEKLDRLNMFYFVSELDSEFDNFSGFIKQGTDEFVAEKKAEFDKCIKEIENIVENYFDSLQTVIEVKLSEQGITSQ